MDYIKYEVRVYSTHTVWRNEQGQVHREGGPAEEYSCGTKGWYLNGLLHRSDGPAVERASGKKEWYLNGKQLTEEEFKRQTEPKSSCEGKIVEIDGQKYKLVKA